MAYQPIENYGIIGNMRTAALVGRDGSIDWLCFPHFDSPSIFAAILDDAKGGRFSIVPKTARFTTKQFYWPETNVLITRFLSSEGVGEIEDFMPVGVTGPDLYHQLIRRIKVVRGQMTFCLSCHPAFDYARTPHDTHLNSNGAVFSTAALTLGLATTLPLKQDERGVCAEFTLQRGEHVACVLREIDQGNQCMKAVASRVKPMRSNP